MSMPLILSLALAVQTIPEAEPLKPEMACAYAVSATAGDKADMILLSAQVSYYAMHAARADLRGKSFFDRVSEIAGTMPQAAGTVSPTAFPTMLPACDKQYPLARATAAVRLPQDPFARDMMCMSVLSVMLGAAQAAEEDGDAKPLTRIQPLFDGYMGRLTDERSKAAGLTDTASIAAAMGKAASDSLELGNAEMVTGACEAALKT
jgi:hypothetical protein